MRARPQQEQDHIDFARALEPRAWHDALAGVDLIINAVGILREGPGQCFDVLHRQAPAALFSACVEQNVGRLISVSALGADADADADTQSAYHLSKRAGDEFLFSLPLDAVVLQPSLVYGADGTSARLFGLLASLPLMPLPAGGWQAALITGYTLIISWKLPEYWLHPYGLVLKNLPMLVAIWLLYELEERT